MSSSKTKQKELPSNEIKTIEELNSIHKFKPWAIDNLTKKRLFLMILCFILTLGPIRFIIVILLHLICLIFMQIMVIGTKPEQPYSNFRKRLIEVVTQFLCRLACFFYGYVNIKFVGEKNVRLFFLFYFLPFFFVLFLKEISVCLCLVVIQIEE
ncbi:lysophosphatidylcholine acyltransferase 1 [Anaeramoeba flamelloides]|uniref:Lysophosphatidylcholine acyltransferase 1 n=1 Tax=Anaeramoeba flamelloides TaxID=1746091 RepID=A0ABQ8XBF1_9EUKA|nr:lysophosphatidylcholine acyltransferase 1 [Anaeramoeba flamelloides]